MKCIPQNPKCSITEKNNHPNRVPMCNSVKNAEICQYSPCRYSHEQVNIEKISPATNNIIRKNIPSQQTDPETGRSQGNFSTRNTAEEKTV